MGLRRRTVAEMEDLDRLAEDERKRIEPTPRKPAVAIAPPGGAKEVKASGRRLEFKLDAGKVRAAVEALRDELTKSGWKAEAGSLEPLGGAAHLKKGDATLTILYFDTGPESAEVSISDVGATIEASKPC